jgi:hypothetical protein
MILHVETKTPTQIAAQETRRRLNRQIASHARIQPPIKRSSISGHSEVPDRISSSTTFRPVDHEDVPHPPMIVRLWVDHCLDDRPTVRQVQRVVAHHYQWELDDLLGCRRSQDVVVPRQIAMYLAKKLTLLSWCEVGRRFGNRDHTTVLHGSRKIATMMMKDSNFKAGIDDLEKQIVGAMHGR